MDVVAGPEAFTVDRALDVILAYESEHPITVQHFDLGGPDEVDIDDRVSTADLGRMVLIDAGLRGADAARLLEFDLYAGLRDLGIDLQLEDVDQRAPGAHSVYARMNTVWTDLVGLPNIGRAKASKLLHLKRPKLFPIIDSRIADLYKPAAKEIGRSLGWAAPHYWAAIAHDVQANQLAFADIRDRLRQGPPASRRMMCLSDLRLQDILAWRPTTE